MSDIVYEVYEETDSILPEMDLENPCGVRIEITADFVRLFVDRRDWSWSRKTGLLNGCGTRLAHPQADGEE